MQDATPNMLVELLTLELTERRLSGKKGIKDFIATGLSFFPSLPEGFKRFDEQATRSHHCEAIFEMFSILVAVEGERLDVTAVETMVNHIGNCGFVFFGKQFLVDGYCNVSKSLTILIGNSC